MRNECFLPATMSIDTKRGRIRIHKAVLHQLGDPRYIQLLVNPADMVVAVRCIDAPLFEDSVHIISRNRVCPAFSYEIYSRLFVAKLSTLVTTMGTEYLYRISGKVILPQRMAIFDLKTRKRTES